MVHQQGNRELGIHFSESLAEADALTTEERCESKGVPWLTGGSERPFVIRSLHVEAFRHVLAGLNPLVEIVVDSFEVDPELGSLLDLQFLVVAKAYFSVLDHCQCT